MKYLKIFAVALVAAMLLIPNAGYSQSLSSILGSAKSATASATTSGRAAGAALKSLYTQYKADGKLDMKNASNLLSLATLANNLQGLKNQTDKSDFYKQFAAGLVTGSGNLVNKSNSSSIMSGLSNLVNNVDLSGLQNVSSSEKTSETIENASTIANSVSNILNVFKK